MGGSATSAIGWLYPLTALVECNAMHSKLCVQCMEDLLAVMMI